MTENVTPPILQWQHVFYCANQLAGPIAARGCPVTPPMWVTDEKPSLVAFSGAYRRPSAAPLLRDIPRTRPGTRPEFGKLATEKTQIFGSQTKKNFML